MLTLENRAVMKLKDDLYLQNSVEQQQILLSYKIKNLAGREVELLIKHRTE